MHFNGLNRWISTILTIIVVIAMLLTMAAATGTLVINGSGGALAGLLRDSYAVGADGLGVIGSDTAYALTAEGAQQITDGGAAPPDGGDGFAELSGNINIKYDTVKIGFYSAASGSSGGAVSSSTLTNVTGSGFAVGYYDDNRDFVQITTTSSTSVTIKPNPDSAATMVITNSSGGTVYTTNSSVVALLPISSGKAVTKLSNNGYTLYGGFEYRRASGGNMTVIGVMNIEDYVKGVIPYEMSSSWPVEALKAQAVGARNYVAANFNKYSSYGFDIVNTASDQVCRGTAAANANSDKAVDETAGLYLVYNGSNATYKGKLCSCYYFSADGGATESSENVWVAALPYCRGKLDPYEDGISFTVKEWEKSFTTAEISAKISSTYKLGDIASIQQTMSPSGNCIKITITDVNGNSKSHTKSSVATFLRNLGFPYTSMHYTVTYDAATDTYTISGGGWGHNCGMSQWGAYSMAKVYGKTYQEILGFYYTDVCLSTGVYS